MWIIKPSKSLDAAHGRNFGKFSALMEYFFAILKTASLYRFGYNYNCVSCRETWTLFPPILDGLIPPNLM